MGTGAPTWRLNLPYRRPGASEEPAPLVSERAAIEMNRWNSALEQWVIILMNDLNTRDPAHGATVRDMLCEMGEQVNRIRANIFLLRCTAAKHNGTDNAVRPLPEDELCTTLIRACDVRKKLSGRREDVLKMAKESDVRGLFKIGMGMGEIIQLFDERVFWEDTSGMLGLIYP